MKNLNIITGGVIREFRKKAGLGYKRLSDNCDVGIRYLVMIEKGENLPSLKIIFKIAKGIGVSGWEIVREIEKRNEENLI